MFTLLHRAPFGPAFAAMRRALLTMSTNQSHSGAAFLPVPGLVRPQYDFGSLAPDQLQEMRYGLGRRTPRGMGDDR